MSKEGSIRIQNAMEKSSMKSPSTSFTSFSPKNNSSNVNTNDYWEDLVVKQLTSSDRIYVVDRFKQIFTKENYLTDISIENISICLEKAIYDKFSPQDSSNKKLYNSKVKSLLFNLERNKKLVSDIISTKISLEDLIRLSQNELAAADIIADRAKLLDEEIDGKRILESQEIREKVLNALSNNEPEQADDNIVIESPSKKLKADEIIIEENLAIPATTENIGDISLTKSLSGVKGMVTKEYSSDGIIGPLPVESYSSCLCITITHGNFLIDVFFYNEYAEKLQFLSELNEIIIFGPSSIVYETDGSRNASTRFKNSSFVKFCICFIPKTGSVASRIHISGSNLARSIVLNDNNIKAIVIQMKQIAHNTIPESTKSRPLASNITSNVTYTSLANLMTRGSQALTESVNIFAVVVSFIAPKATTARAKDKLSASYHLIDMSHDNTQFPIVFNLFGNFMENFPINIAVGNVIRIHGVKCQIHNSKLQLVGNIEVKKASILTFHNKFTGLSNVLAEEYDILEHLPNIVPATAHVGLSDSEWLVQLYSRSREFSFDPSQATQVEELHNWAQRTLFQKSLASDISESTNARLDQLILHRFPMLDPSLSHFVSSRCDIVGVIVSVTIPQDNDTNALGSVVIWDGTSIGSLVSSDSNFSPRSVVKAIKMATVYSTCTNYEDMLTVCSSHIENILSNNFSDEILHGMGVLVRVSEPSMNAVIAQLQPGMWVRFRNLLVEPKSSELSNLSSSNLNPSIIQELISKMSQATIFPETHICQLLPYYFDVKECAVRYRQFIERLQRQFPQAATNNAPIKVPTRRTTSKQGYTLTPLVLAKTTKSPAQFCVTARIISWYPKNISDFILSDQVTINNETVDVPHFCFSIRIADDSAELDVLFYDSDAETLLKMTIDEFHSDALSPNKIHNKLTTYFEKETIVDFCIKSYTTTNDESSLSLKRFRGFNAVLE